MLQPHLSFSPLFFLSIISVENYTYGGKKWLFFPNLFPFFLFPPHHTYLPGFHSPFCILPSWVFPAKSATNWAITQKKKKKSSFGAAPKPLPHLGLKKRTKKTLKIIPSLWKKRGERMLGWGEICSWMRKAKNGAKNGIFWGSRWGGKRQQVGKWEYLGVNSDKKHKWVFVWFFPPLENGQK